MTSSTEIDVTALAADLQADDVIAVAGTEPPVALCRTEAGLFAVANTCTHAQAALSDGFVFENSIECPLHQARYDLTTGALLEGPACPALATYAVHEQGERVFIRLA